MICSSESQHGIIQILPLPEEVRVALLSPLFP